VIEMVEIVELVAVIDVVELGNWTHPRTSDAFLQSHQKRSSNPIEAFGVFDRSFHQVTILHRPPSFSLICFL